MNRYMIPDLKRIRDCLEIADIYNMAFEYNDFYQPEILDDVQKQKEIIEQYKGLNRNRKQDTLHGAFLDVTVASYDRKIREVSKLRVRQSMDIAEELGVKAVILHTNYISNFPLKSYCDSWVSGNAEFFREILSEYKGKRIYIENMFDDTPDLLGRLAAEMKEEERFGVCLDIAHAAISRTPIKDWFSHLAPYIRHMHVNDNNLYEDLHLAMGQGEIDWSIYRELMDECALRPSVLIEVKGIDKVKTSIDYMKEQRLYPFDRETE